MRCGAISILQGISLQAAYLLPCCRVAAILLGLIPILWALVILVTAGADMTHLHRDCVKAFRSPHGE